METMTLVELAAETGVPVQKLRDWVRRGLLPKPLPEARRRRCYKMPREETMEAVKQLAQARQEFLDAREHLKTKK
jgi:DNA-binding transcriptional MerR regulator